MMRLKLTLSDLEVFSRSNDVDRESTGGSLIYVRTQLAMNDDKSKQRSTDLLTVQAVADSLGYRLG